ncbi:MAG TPA: hypothetical protein VFQ76_18190 [Longimicrobiaceae bacterium]|nr:hypothetical protein [Longimicrobiaceae bacterium]
MTSPRALLRVLLLALLLGVPLLPGTAMARQSVQNVQSRVERLERQVADMADNSAPTGLVLFLFGAFCALWAQNSGRNPWLWFVLGIFFSVVTVIFLLLKNAADARESRPPPFDLERFRKQ